MLRQVGEHMVGSKRTQHLLVVLGLLLVGCSGEAALEADEVTADLTEMSATTGPGADLTASAVVETPVTAVLRVTVDAAAGSAAGLSGDEASATVSSTETTTTTTTVATTTKATTTTAAPTTASSSTTAAAVSTSTPSATSGSGNDELSRGEQASLELLNELRRSLGLGELAMNDAEMSEFARSWSKEMRETGFRHSSAPWGENIVWYSAARMTPEEAAAKFHDMWINSPGHYRNMTKPGWTVVGVGFYHDESGWWGTHVFR